jgi:hypothetical protein
MLVIGNGDDTLAVSVWCDGWRRISGSQRSVLSPSDVGSTDAASDSAFRTSRSTPLHRMLFITPCRSFD